MKLNFLKKLFERLYFFIINVIIEKSKNVLFRRMCLLTCFRILKIHRFLFIIVEIIHFFYDVKITIKFN